MARMVWIDADLVRRREDSCPVHWPGKCPVQDTFSLAVCPIHGTTMHDTNGYGARFTHPTCLECQGLKGHAARIVQLKPSQYKTGFYLNYIPPEKANAKWREEFRRRLMRLLVHTGQARQEDPLEIEDMAKMIGAGTVGVLEKLRLFETGQIAKRRKRKAKDK